MATENIFSQRFLDLKDACNNLEDLTDAQLKELMIQAQEVHSEYENLQLVVKRNANSLYGTSASKYFSLHNTDMAEDITGTAKHFAIIVDKAITKFFCNWATSDKRDEHIKRLQEFYPQVTGIINHTTEDVDCPEALCVYGDTDSRYLRNDMIYNLIETSNGNLQLPESDEEL